MNSASRPLNRAFLSLGSNVRPEVHLPAAAQLLADYGRIVAVSQVWQSTPFGFQEQADFLNAAVLLETELSAEQLIGEVIPQVEEKLGRRRDPENPNGPRTIDVDLSLFNDHKGRVLGRMLPDPALRSRLFVVQPLSELDSSATDPGTGEPLTSIAERLWATEGPLTLRADVTVRGRNDQ